MQALEQNGRKVWGGISCFDWTLVARSLSSEAWDTHTHTHTKNIDKCVESLGEIELKALVLYCKSAGSTYLDIPIYYVRDFDNDISEVPLDTPFTMV